MSNINIKKQSLEKLTCWTRSDNSSIQQDTHGWDKNQFLHNVPYLLPKVQPETCPKLLWLPCWQIFTINLLIIWLHSPYTSYSMVTLTIKILFPSASYSLKGRRTWWNNKHDCVNTTRKYWQHLAALTFVTLSAWNTRVTLNWCIDFTPLVVLKTIQWYKTFCLKKMFFF